MNDPLSTLAQTTVSAARLVTAAWYGSWGIAFVMLGIWLASPFQNQLFIIIGLVVAVVCGGKLLMQAGEAYVGARPQQRPDERQRYLESRALYTPGKTEAERKQKREAR